MVKMPDRNINLTEPQASRVDDLVRSGRYRDASECFADLLQRDQEAECDRRELSTMLIEGLNSGEAVEMTPDQLDERLKAVIEAAATRWGRTQ